MLGGCVTIGDANSILQLDVLYARGRARIHRDEKLWGSADAKHVIEERARRGASPDLFKRRCASQIRRAVRALGGDDLIWVPVHGDAEAMIDALQRAGAENSNVSVGVVRYDTPSEGSA